MNNKESYKLNLCVKKQEDCDTLELLGKIPGITTTFKNYKATNSTIEEYYYELKIDTKALLFLEKFMPKKDNRLIQYIDFLTNAQKDPHFKQLSEESEYSCAMKSHFRKFGNQMSGSGNHLCNYASLLA
ncbi:MAG: hypothetical protein ACLR26_20650 [Blautia wexlerae]